MDVPQGGEELLATRECSGYLFGCVRGLHLCFGYSFVVVAMSTPVKTASPSNTRSSASREVLLDRILELERDNTRLRRNIDLHTEKNDNIMSLRYIRPTKYDGLLYFVDYYAQFLTVAAHHGWDDTTKGIVLLSHLEGKALSVAGACNTFAEMVEALSDACGREKGDAAALKLRSRCQKQGESLEELSRDIVGLV
ncbi:hypothetical protein CAPTEDRAFT_191738 [Capitella teleta]|uniref:Uncharacterized protein n=1 Tax=Capitella teleta TaxID=283909 RepID=R7TQ22_CAPTE|nr:hypothetical protein CAPTEDRAFT_191738 [Capitella teleta]|eukprot:ELT95749.1 hypothetical protein CAPTEDRAFT_191738 [Capitella teleta]